jgi:2-oxoacid:acceptor oxidoreductase delta subunit (pyruvate/2-ketoisovalerate family)
MTMKIVKTFYETIDLVKKGDFDFGWRPETIEDLCQEGPRCLPSRGAPASVTPDFMMREYLPKFHKEKCSQCGTCWVFCPLGIIYEEEDGSYGYEVEFCRACGICAHECPTQAIEMVRLIK